MSEEEWTALFDLDRAGVRRAVLAERFGVSPSTLTWQARKRGRMKTQDPLAVDHRRKPAEGWPADHVFGQSASEIASTTFQVQATPDALAFQSRGEACPGSQVRARTIDLG